MVLEHARKPCAPHGLKPNGFRAEEGFRHMKKKQEAKEPEATQREERRSVMVHPPGELFRDAVIFIALLLATLIVNRYLPFLNIVFLFVKWGSLLLLLLTIATITYLFKLFAHLWHGISTLSRTWKAVIFIFIVMLAVYLFLIQDAYMPGLIGLFWNMPWERINPISLWWY
jgi:cation transport ATPase